MSWCRLFCHHPCYVSSGSRCVFLSQIVSNKLSCFNYKIYVVKSKINNFILKDLALLSILSFCDKKIISGTTGYNIYVGTKLTHSMELSKQNFKKRNMIFKSQAFEYYNLSRKHFVLISPTVFPTYTVYLLGYFLCGWLNHALIICAKVQRTPQG